MAKCGACGKFLSSTGGVGCTVCPNIFHRACLMVSDGTTISKDWVCPECKKKSRKGDNSCTPVRGISGNTPQEPQVIRSPPCSVGTQKTALNDDDSPARELSRQLVACMVEMRELRKEMAELHTSVACFTERMNGFERRLEVIEQMHTPTKVKVNELEKTVNLLKQELNDRDQEALLSDLEIGHLPEEKGENITHTISVLAVRLGVPLEERDVVFAERVGAAPLSLSASTEGGVAIRARRVVVRLARRSLRDELLRAARVRRSITTADIGLASSPQRLYVNERLTRNNRQLFHRVREACRKLSWRYSWTRRGRVYVRQAEDKPVYSIRTDDDFNRVFQSNIVCISSSA
ncbi:unnamed protein product [Parnassius mnemosyne]|uniref:Zinc finger PHD-type domain-containing protein n=1 Tax=Parnassius mnemosyne TaxID=213953 RepID=A0AAV1K728_9NEOP